MPASRKLLVVADDYGIGPATSCGILRLCQAGAISGTVLLVNSPYATDAVTQWQKAGPPADLGWHPCLTLDAPILPAACVPTLVNPSGNFHSLGQLIARVFTGRIRLAEVSAEFRAQLNRFRELVGHDPLLVNSHHHIQVFPIIGAALRQALSDCTIRPYLRCVREPFHTLRFVRGARAKRSFLSMFGRREAHVQLAGGFPGNDWLAGITDPPFVHDAQFFANWLTHTPGQLVELTCHPGERDESLIHRDARPGDGNLERRVQELDLLRQSNFRSAQSEAGFRMIRVAELLNFDQSIRIAG